MVQLSFDSKDFPLAKVSYREVVDSQEITRLKQEDLMGNEVDIDDMKEAGFKEKKGMPQNVSKNETETGGHPCRRVYQAAAIKQVDLGKLPFPIEIPSILGRRERIRTRSVGPFFFRPC